MLFILSLLNCFFPLALHMLGERFGMRGLVWSAAGIFVLLGLLSPNDAMSCLLIVLLPVIFIFQKSPAKIISQMIAIWAVIIGIGLLLFPNPEQWAVLELPGQVQAFFPGLIGISWALMHFINAVIAWRIKGKKWEKNYGPYWDIVLVLGLMLGFVPALLPLAKNICLLASVPLFLHGVETIWQRLAGFSLRSWILLGIVCLMLLVKVWSLLLVVVGIGMSKSYQK